MAEKDDGTPKRRSSFRKPNRPANAATPAERVERYANRDARQQVMAPMLEQYQPVVNFTRREGDVFNPQADISGGNVHYGFDDTLTTGQPLPSAYRPAPLPDRGGRPAQKLRKRSSSR